MLSEDLEPAGPAPDVPAGHDEQAEGQAAEAATAEDELGLASISLPASTIRKIARSAAPGVRFSAEAFAGLHRVAQAFVCYATDRALAEVKIEVDKGKRPKGKAFVPPPRKTLSCDHVMRFLSRDLPPIGSKVAALFPQLMSSEFKPAGVQLLEQLHEQQRAAAKAAVAGEPQTDSVSSTLDGFASAAAGAWAGAAEEGADNGLLPAAGKRPNDNIGGPVKASKKMRTGNEPADGASAVPVPEAQGKKVKAKPATASLTRFFGAQSSSAPAAPPPADSRGKDPPAEFNGLAADAEAVSEVVASEVVFEDTRQLTEEDAQLPQVSLTAELSGLIEEELLGTPGQ